MNTFKVVINFLRSIVALIRKLFLQTWGKNVDQEYVTTLVDKTPEEPAQPKPKFEKLLHNPILGPNNDNWWESWQVFNPGVLHLEDKTHVFYRSIGSDGLSRFGYAVLQDDHRVEKRYSYPVYSHKVISKVPFYSASGGSFGGCEDPRLHKVKEDPNLYITYTACDGGLRVALTSIDEEDLKKERWKWSDPVFMSPPGEIHKNWVIFPEKINGKYAILHSITPNIQIDYVDSLDFDEDQHINSVHKHDNSREGMWDSWVRGVGPPPLKTKEGWLIFYHGMDRTDPREYKVGAMLTDLDDPTKVLHRSSSPILEPDQDYENNGFKAGVVYVSGALIKEGKLILYYGASDSYICAATADLEEFLTSLINEEKVVFKNKLVNSVTSII